MKRQVTLKTQQEGVDKFLLVFPIILTLVGLTMVTNASAVQAQNLFGDKFFFAKQQLVWAGLGLFGFLASTRIPYYLWRRLALVLFLVNILLLMVVLFPQIGISALGARRWIEIGGFNFQPAELAKLTSILYISRLLAGKFSFFAFFLVVGVVCGLVVAEPDLGTTVIIGATSLALLFVSGAPTFIFMLLLPILAGVVSLLILTSGYRRARFLSFVSGIFDPLSSSYHIKQVLLAIASGGIFGVGLGQSRQKFLFLPEAATDSIFAVMAEEMGLLGAAAIVVIFLLLVFKIFSVAQAVEDSFGKLVATGVGIWIGVQAFVNIAAMTATLPLTGVPLPFFSYGGSSLFVTLFALGIVVNISGRMRVAK